MGTRPVWQNWQEVGLEERECKQQQQQQNGGVGVGGGGEASRVKEDERTGGWGKGARVGGGGLWRKSEES